MAAFAELTPIEHAINAARHGIRVFRLHANGKSAALHDWPKLATSDETRIRKWWGRIGCQDSNIGWVLGDQLSNGRYLLAVDIDMKRDAEGNLIADGEATFRALCDELELDHEALSKTLTQWTPSGQRPDGTHEGGHLFFSTSRPMGNSVGKLGPGLDTRGVCGYVVGCGSQIDGRSYEVVDWTAPILELPEAIEARLNAVSVKVDTADRKPLEGTDPARALARALEYLKTAPPAIQRHGGDLQTLKVALKLKEIGIPQEQALGLMAECWDDRNSPPWEHEELATKVRNAYVYGQNREGSGAPENVFQVIPEEEMDARATITSTTSPSTMARRMTPSLL